MSSRFADEFSSRLHEHRRHAGMTQVALSDLTGIDQPRLSRMERGETAPSVEELIAISQALKVEVLDLMGIEAAGGGAGPTSRRLAQLLDRISPADRKLLIQIAELMAKRGSRG